MPKTPNLTARSIHLLREIAAGRSRIFYTDARPPGFLQVSRAGLVVAVDGTDRAELTEAVRQFVAALPAGEG